MSNFDDVLAQCLADIEAGKKTVEHCLARSPEHAQELGPLLRTAVALRTAPAVEPSPAFAAAAQTRLLNVIAARQQTATQPRPVPARRTRRWSSVLVKATVAVVLASFMLGGTAYAARDSLPDSPLYPVKRTVEQVQVAITPNDVRKARVFLRLMDQRAIETAAMIRRGNIERSRQTTLHYIVILKEADAIAARVPANHAEGRTFLSQMRERLLAHQAAFQRIQTNAPERANLLLRPVLSNIQLALDRINTQVGQ